MAKICVPVCVRRVEELAGAVERAARVGDIVELRLDYLGQPEAGIVAVRELINRMAAQLIVTMRSADQGDATTHHDEARLRFWSRAEDIPNVLFDIEFDFLTETNQSSFDWNRVICSRHDFGGVPHDLDEIYKAMAATPARTIKIAVHANDATDCLPICRLLERAGREERNLIAIAMGESGVMTRILGPSRGSFLTYAALDEASETAPGQITAEDLREVYRIDQIDSQTELFGIIGNPVGHSLSPRIHNAAFAAANLNAVYIPFEVRDATQFMRRMVHPKSRELDWNLRGLSVTAPHKSTVMKSLDWIDLVAKEIGAVNTIVVLDDQLFGYNTDAAGLIASLAERFGSVSGARCAVIGAGGAARAALWALREASANVTLFARNVQKGRELSARYNVACKPLANARYDGFDIVINATPLGTHGDYQNETAATAEQLRGVRLAYDLVYNLTETRFIAEARKAGCATLGGIEMLLAQAVEQFKLWTGKEPSLDAMRAAAMKGLTESS